MSLAAGSRTEGKRMKKEAWQLLEGPGKNTTRGDSA
jgi:hypothetical protein